MTYTNVHVNISELQQQKLKHAVDTKSPISCDQCFSCLFHTCSVLYVFVECRLFRQFSRDHRQHFRKDFARIKLDLGSVSIFLKVIEKHLFKKIQKHEKQKTLIESQINSIRNMVSKALSNNEVSESEFEKILFETEKYRNKVETYRSFDEVNLDLDEMLTKKSESFIWNK